MKDYKFITTVTVPELSGGKVIADSRIFDYIDPNFKNWDADKIGQKTPEVNLDVFEVTKDMSFSEMFDKENLLTQAQILYFVENNKSLLSDWYTFLPFKCGDEVFVASVARNSAERLEAHVSRLASDDVWNAEFRFRVVLPQLPPRVPAETLSPSAVDTIVSIPETLTINGVIYKPMTPKLKLTCTNISCPERTGGECTADRLTIGQIPEKLDQSEPMLSGYAKIESIESDWEAELKQDYDDGWFFGNDPRMTNKPVNFLRLRHYIRDLLHTKANPVMGSDEVMHPCPASSVASEGNWESSLNEKWRGFCDMAFPSKEQASKWWIEKINLLLHTQGNTFQKKVIEAHEQGFTKGIRFAGEQLFGVANLDPYLVTDDAVRNGKKAFNEIYERGVKAGRIMVLDELAERLKKTKKGLNTVNKSAYCNPYCHDSSTELALDTVLGIIQELKVK